MVAQRRTDVVVWGAEATAVGLVEGAAASLAAEGTGPLAVTAVARAMTVETAEAHAAAAVSVVSAVSADGVVG